MKLTKQNIHAALNNGSPNKAQCQILGIKYPLPNGWLRGLVGLDLPDEQYTKLCGLRKLHPGKRRTENVPQQDKHVTSVQLKMTERAAQGLAKYGTNTERTDLTRLDWLRHAQEEAMDQAIYLEVLIQLELNQP